MIQRKIERTLFHELWITVIFEDAFFVSESSQFNALHNFKYSEQFLFC